MRALAVFLIFLTVPVAQGTFQPSREADFWRATGIDLTFAQRFVSNRLCYRDEKLFRSCRAGILAAGKLLGMGKPPGDVNGRLSVSVRLDSDDSASLASFANASFEGPRVDFDSALVTIDRAATAAALDRTPKQMIFASLINALLREFDAHARIVPIDYLRANLGSTGQDMTGIGVDEEITGAGVFIRRIYPDTPAAAVGLKVNDRIATINGHTLAAGTEALGALKALSSSSDGKVRLGVERETRLLAPIEIPIARLHLSDVRAEFDRVNGATYMVLQIRVFSRGVCAAVQNQMSFASGKVQGALLDLRGNMGGLMDEAACVTSLFNGARAFVTTHPLASAIPAVEFGLDLPDSKTGAPEAWTDGLGPALWPSLPLVVLVNAFSASAAEMMAAALQDHQRAWVVGERTFGKGTTQKITGVPGHDNLRLVYTVSYYARPNGAANQLVGITPDFTVPFRARATAPERSFPREAEIFGVTVPAISDATPTSVGNHRADSTPAVGRISSCIRRKHLARDLGKWQRRRFGFEDNQKAYAFAVLRCRS
jgi:carboxyl-terminal processing protease